MSYKELIIDRGKYKRKKKLYNVSKINSSYEEGDYQTFISYVIKCFYPSIIVDDKLLKYLKEDYFDRFHKYNYGNLRQIVFDIGILLKVEDNPMSKLIELYENTTYNRNSSYNKKFKFRVLPKFN